MLEDTRAAPRPLGSGPGSLGYFPHAPAACAPALAHPPAIPGGTEAPLILVFDSGLGGLTVFREVTAARPDARFLYVADDALFPYGAIEEQRLVAHVLALMEKLIAAHRPALVVIACNTASTSVLPALRQRFAVPFVGTVPAIKPACAASRTGWVSVLGTEATIQREYTRELVRSFAGSCRVTLVGSARLAGFAERELAGDPVPDDVLRAEIAAAFVKEADAATDTVVLACTHYPLLAGRLAAVAPWPVRWIDPAPAIARRVLALLGAAGASTSAGEPGRILFTSGRIPSPALAASLGRFGFGSEVLGFV